MVGVLAQEFGWRIQVIGASAPNFLGLSTRVPGRVVYVSDAPDRAFKAGKLKLELWYVISEDATFEHREGSALARYAEKLGGVVSRKSCGAVCRKFSILMQHELLHLNVA